MILRSRFLWKLYIGYSALILIFAVIVWVLIAQRIEHQSLDDIKQSLHARAVMLSSIVRPSLENNVDNAQLQYDIQKLGQGISTRLTVIKIDGQVIADSVETPATMDNHANRPEILAASTHGTGTATRFSDTVGTKMMYHAVPVKKTGYNNITTGYVRTSLSLEVVDERLNHLSAVIALGIGIAAVIALILGFILVQPFIKPLVSMTSAARLMAQGDYHQKLHISQNDEIGHLAQALNQMSERYHRRMETINQESNKLSTILAGIVEGIVAIDKNERLLHINHAAETLLGINTQQSLSRPVWEIIRIPEICQILTDTMQQYRILQRNLTLTTQPNDVIVEMHASPLNDSRDNLIGAVLVLHDVSDLHRLDMIRRDFVANASHELKTPITAMQGLIETIIDDNEMDTGTHDRFLKKAHNQIIRLSSIVKDLLTISRLESENHELLRSTIELSSIIRTSVNDLTPAAEDKNIDLISDLPDIPVKTTGDEKALHQTITNLLDNAIKYTHRNGKVEITLSTDKDHAAIEVKDNGLGIDPKDQERIFERFYRVDKARSRELGGTGLGLSIVRHVILAHKGNISVNSIPGAGSTFRITLPLIPPVI